MGGCLRLQGDYLDSPSLAACSERARVSWHRIVMAAHDSHGCFKVNVPEIYAVAFSGKWSVKAHHIPGFLDEFEGAGMLIFFNEASEQVFDWQLSTGRVYGYWTGWAKYNRIDTRFKRQTPPPPEVVVLQPSAEMQKDAERSHEITRDNPSSTPTPTSIPNPIPTPSESEFDCFWQAYPKKEAKLAAEKAWKARRPPIEAVLKALDWQRSSSKWQDDGGKYIPHPAKWINAGRWLDEQPVEVDSREEASQGERTAEEIEALLKRRGVTGA